MCHGLKSNPSFNMTPLCSLSSEAVSALYFRRPDSGCRHRGQSKLSDSSRYKLTSAEESCKISLSSHSLEHAFCHTSTRGLDRSQAPSSFLNKYELFLKIKSATRQMRLFHCLFYSVVSRALRPEAF